MQPSRRSILRLPFLTALTKATPGSASGPKNVLFLLSDQHKPRFLGVNSAPGVRTPNLDNLARSGLRFDSAYCAHPVCGPARASLWTGLHTHNHGVLRNEVPWPADLKCVARSFGRAGYRTAAIGKMHFANAQTHGFDYRLDFNDWYQYLGPKARIYANEVGGAYPGDGHPQIGSLWAEDPWAGEYEPDGRKGKFHLGRVSQLAEADHFDSFVARESIHFLKAHAAKGPFFLVASFLKPHQPFMPAERFARMFDVRDMRLPSSWGRVNLETVPAVIRRRITTNTFTPELLDPELAKHRIAAYYALTAQMDDCAGAVLNALESQGLARDTIVVYTSDHGEMLGEHGLWQKFVFYESSVGVPLMMRVPGMTPANAVCRVPVSHVQLVSTLTELCDVRHEARTDGASLVPFLREAGLHSEAAVFAEFDLGTQKPKYMVRQGDWKYCYYKDDMDELYDLGRDPEEMINLAALKNGRGKVREMKARLSDWHPGCVDRE